MSSARGSKSDSTTAHDDAMGQVYAEAERSNAQNTAVNPDIKTTENSASLPKKMKAIKPLRLLSSHLDPDLQKNASNLQKQATANNAKLTLFKLPNNIFGLVSDNLEAGAVNAVNQSCKEANRLFQNQLTDEFKEKQPLLQKLLQYVVDAEYDHAEEFIKWHYRFQLVSSNKTIPEPLEKDVIYVKQKGNALEYSLTTSDGQCAVKNRPITLENLNKINQSQNKKDEKDEKDKKAKSDQPIEIPNNFTKENLKALRPLILAITNENKYTQPKNNRCLLTMKGEVKDYSGRRIKGTALGIALGQEDVSRETHPDEGMAEMIMNELRKLPEGETHIKNQKKAQFPEGWEAKEEKRHTEDLKALRKVRNALIASISNDDPELIAAIQEFKEYLEPKGVIESGKHWNARLLQTALQMGWDDFFYPGRQGIFFYIQVISCINTHASTHYAMAQAQGLHYLLDIPEKFNRSLEYRVHSGHHFYPLSFVPGFRLGFDSWVDFYYGGLGGGGRDASRYTGIHLWKTYGAQKHQRLTQILDTPIVTPISNLSSNLVQSVLSQTKDEEIYLFLETIANVTISLSCQASATVKVLKQKVYDDLKQRNLTAPESIDNITILYRGIPYDDQFVISGIPDVRDVTLFVSTRNKYLSSPPSKDSTSSTSSQMKIILSPGPSIQKQSDTHKTDFKAPAASSSSSSSSYSSSSSSLKTSTSEKLAPYKITDEHKAARSKIDTQYKELIDAIQSPMSQFIEKANALPPSAENNYIKEMMTLLDKIWKANYLNIDHKQHPEVTEKLRCDFRALNRLAVDALSVRTHYNKGAIPFTGEDPTTGEFPVIDAKGQDENIGFIQEIEHKLLTCLLNANKTPAEIYNDLLGTLKEVNDKAQARYKKESFWAFTGTSNLIKVINSVLVKNKLISTGTPQSKATP